MNRIKKLDDIVKKKLSLLPTSTLYSKILKQIVEDRKSEKIMLNEFNEISVDIGLLRNELKVLSEAEFSQKINDICDIKTQKFLNELNDLEKSLSRFSTYIRDNEKRSEIQLDNLVAARIDTTDVLIDLLHKMKDDKLVDGIDLQKLYDVKRNLQKGYDSVQQYSQFKVLSSNEKSGNFNRFIDEDY